MPATRARLTKAAVLAEVRELRTNVGRIAMMTDQDVVDNLRQSYPDTWADIVIGKFGGMTLAESILDHRRYLILGAIHHLTNVLGVE